MKEQGFLKAHRLSSKKDIEHLIAKGNSCIEFPLRFLWTCVPSEQSAVRVAISVPKKRFAHAVDRNVLKRRIREAFRLQFSTSQTIPSFEIHILIVYVDSTIHEFSLLDTKLRKALQKIYLQTKNIHV